MNFLIRIMAAALVATTASVSFADQKTDILNLIHTGDVEAVEATLAQLDHDSQEPRYLKNDNLREAFAVFETSHPDVVDFMITWKAREPDSLYQKAAQALQLSHLAWLIRGTNVISRTYYKALQESDAYNSEASALAWEVFSQRPDFVPASDILPILYRKGYGQMPFSEFVDIALTANPDFGSLKKIVYANNPKWGGNWAKISALCERYADKVSSPEYYNVEICKAFAVYDSFVDAFESGPGAARLARAQAALEKVPLTELVWHHRQDRVYFRPNLPGAKRFVLDTFDPSDRKARYIADAIQRNFKVRMYSRTQLPRIQEAEKARLALDPYNPELLMRRAYDLYQSAEVYTDAKLNKEFRQLAKDMRKYGLYQPDTWLISAWAEKEDRTDNLLSEEAMQYYERAIITSNYNITTIAEYNGALYFGRNMAQKLMHNGTSEMFGREIDAQELFERMSCPFVRTTRLIHMMCGPEVTDSIECRSAGIKILSKQVLETARAEKMCPQILYAPVEKLLYADDPEL